MFALKFSFMTIITQFPFKVLEGSI